MEVHDLDVPQLMVRDWSCVVGVRQREVAFVVRVYGRQEGARSSFLTASLTGLSSLLRDPTHSTEPALTPPQRWPLIPLQRWPRLSQPSRPPLIRTYPLSEMLLHWGPSFCKIPDEFYWEQSPCKPHLQSPSKLDPFRRVKGEQASSRFRLVLVRSLPCSRRTQTLVSPWFREVF